MATDPPQLTIVQIATLLFVMLGPTKFLGPFVAGTRALDDAAVRSLAIKATIMVTVTAIAGAFVGKLMMERAPAPEPAVPLTAFETAFPLVVTPYGMAGVIALLAAAGDDSRRVVMILGIVLAMMVLDLVFMI